jgi:molybdopterin-guanine dinucleotide biosynthesis protein A
MPTAPSRARVGGVLLTGGSSRRLGTDKATLVVRGQRMADHAAAVLAAVCERVVEVGRGVTGLPACREDPVGAGPLAALLAGAAALGADASEGVVLLACDLPAVEAPLVDLIARWPGRPTVVPIADGEPQLVCARYGTDALRAGAATLAAGERSLRRLLDRAEHDLIDPSTWGVVAPLDVFADVDTPADLARLGAIDRSADGHDSDRR